MKTRKFKCLGVESSKEVPSTLKELMGLNLTEEQVVDTAVNQILYHVFLGDVRDKVQAKVELAYPEDKRPFEYAKDKDGKDTKAKKYSVSIEKWLADLVGSERVLQERIDEYVEGAVGEVEFKATSPREKKDPAEAVRFKRAEEIMAKENAQERMGVWCKKMGVDAPSEWTKEAIAKCLLAIDTAI